MKHLRFWCLGLSLSLFACSDTTNENNSQNNNTDDMGIIDDMDTKKADGESCQTNSECASSVCQSGTCLIKPSGPFCGKVYCAEDQACEDNTCTTKSTCAVECGDACCGENQTCFDNQCVDPCPNQGTRCATENGAVCCGAEEACIFDACVPLGNACTQDMPCPRGQYCEPTLNRCVDRNANPNTCVYVPPVETFDPVEAYAWTGSAISPTFDQVMATPVVGNLSDDNNDGQIDENDVPDIVFTTFENGRYRDDGVLRVISGDDGREHWSSTGLATPFMVHSSTTAALGDIDADGKTDIIVQAAAAAGGGYYAISNEGAIKWHVPNLTGVLYGGPSIANVDGKGAPEIITAQHVLSATGQIICDNSPHSSRLPTVADMDGDGTQEIVYGSIIFKVTNADATDGTGCQNITPQGLGSGLSAIANLDEDPNPEIVNVYGNTISVLEHDGTTKWTKTIALDADRVKSIYGIDCNVAPAGQACNANSECGASDEYRCINKTCYNSRQCYSSSGAPTVADFNGDGKADIAIAGRWYYIVYQANGDVLWAHKTKDYSSGVTGSSVFDFEGDGRAEVVYNDEEYLRVYRGTGSNKDEDGDGYNDPVILLEERNTSGTLYEYPLIVDVDNDGSAEIVVSANNYGRTADATSTKGIRVFRDRKNNWVQTRRIWNQHTYHVTNVEENGAIPPLELKNWEQSYLNNYRQNAQGEGLFNAPDLTVNIDAVDADNCVNEVKITLTIENKGSLGIRAGAINTSIWAGRPEVYLTTLTNATALAPGGKETLTYTWSDPPSQLAGKSFDVTAKIDDDGMGNVRHNECNEDNNTAELKDIDCRIPQ